MQKLIIGGDLPSLNEYINIERGNKFAAAQVKEDATNLVMQHIKCTRPTLGPFDEPVFISIVWHCKDKKKDPDNISFAKKFILDGLVRMGVLKQDSWKSILGFRDEFCIDMVSPRIEVILTTHYL